MKPWIIRLFLITGLVYSSMVNSAVYALLVGVSDYQSAPDLDGPVHDVQALQQILLQRGKLKPEHITTLVNEQATKKAILSTLKRLIQQVNAEDQLFIYFSGHGTSGQDDKSNWPLPYGTGAFIPVDFNDKGSEEERMERLIVGKTDLKPLLLTLDGKGVHALVVMDSCFSGNAARSFVNTTMSLPRRFFPAMEADDLEEDFDEFPTEPAPNSVYPYQNILYMAASAEWETAMDIPNYRLTEYPTLDNKPHGAFTDAMIRVLSGDIKGDSNHDGQLNYEELFAGIRQFMQQREYQHTPQLFPSDNNNVSLRTRGVSILSQLSQATAPLLKVQLLGKYPQLVKQLDKTPRLKLVQESPDVMVDQQDSRWVIKNSAGDVIDTMATEPLAQLVRRLHHQTWIRQFVYQTNPKQQFNLSMDFFGDTTGGTAVGGSQLGLSVRSEQAAYLAVLNINKQGDVNVLYPIDQDELNKQIQANQTERIIGKQANDMIFVCPTYGIEYVVAIAFKKPPALLKALMDTKKINANEPLNLKKLEQLIAKPSANWAKTSLRLVTMAGPKPVSCPSF